MPVEGRKVIDGKVYSRITGRASKPAAEKAVMELKREYPKKHFRTFHSKEGRKNFYDIYWG